MTIFDNILISLALGVTVMMTVRSCCSQAQIKLSKGLMMSGVIALFHALFVVLGWWIGSVFQFGFEEYDRLFFLGFLVFVAVKIFVNDHKKGKELPAYDIGRLGTVCLLAVATGVNTFLVGIGLGFNASDGYNWLKLGLPMFLLVLLMAYWGVMLGRQKVELRSRRWVLVAILLIFVVALRGTFWC